MAKKKTINMVKSQVIYKDYSKDAERTALISGENLSHMFGKIARWYTDISWVGHTHTEANITDFGTYAGASTKGGAATSANKLNIGSADIGSETRPVYFSYLTGKPVACTYSLNASVPANAVFTDINVKQSPSTADESREVLFAGNTGNTETTGTVGKSNKLYFNPSTGALTATSFSGSLAASNLTGTIDAGRLPTTAVTAGSYGPAAGGTLTYGGTFDVPYVTVDKYGRLTAGSTKTFTMPAQYTHPSYTSKTSGLYKITVDSLGHVSATAAVTASDLPSHTHNYISSSGITSTTEVQINPTGASYNEGLRIGKASNGWSNINFGCSNSATAGTQSGQWSVGVRGAVGATAGGIGDFIIEHNGASGNGLTLYADGSTPRWNNVEISMNGHTHPYLPESTVTGSPDLDTYLTSGVYHIKTQTSEHAPTTNHATLFVDGTVGTPYQLFIPDMSNGIWYSRYKSGSGAWSSWLSLKMTDTVYTHPTTSGNKHIPSGGSSGQYLKWSSDGTATWSAIAASDLPSHNHNDIQVDNYLTIDTAGWYRLFELGSTSETAARGAGNNSCEIIIKRVYSHTNNEHHEIKLLSIYNNIIFADEISRSNAKVITKIRYVFTATNAFIDIYYDASVSNLIYVILKNNYGYIPWKKRSSVTTVPETATGETVVTTYNFANNSGGDNYLPLAGGTMTGDITFTGVTSTTYPAVSNSIVFSGSTDGGSIFYEVQASDAGALVIQTIDDANAKIVFRNKVTANGTRANEVTIADGVISGNGSGLTNIVSAGKWTTARTITIGSTGKSVDGSGNVSWTLAEIGAAASSHTHSYLPLSGGTMTGAITFQVADAIKYNAASATYTMISFITGDGNGHGISIGGGGVTVLGSGESASALISALSLSATNETTYIASDNNIEFYSNCQTIGNRLGIVFDTSGRLRPNTNNTRTLGGTDYYWNKAYISQLVGRGTGGSWISARDNTVVRQPSMSTTSAYFPVISTKTKLGEWSIGTLGPDAENLYFSYTTDANYNAGTNTASNYYLSSSGWFSGTAAKADKWSTARTLTIGSTGKSVDGSGNVSWSLSEIGAAASSHSHSNYLPQTTATAAPDLNTYTSTGVYHIPYSSTNAPVTQHSTLYVEYGVGTPYQIFKPDNIDTTWYTRHRVSDSWSDWVALKLTDTVYTHPSYTSKAAGLYKITVDGTGHVSATAAVTASDLPSHTHSYIPLAGSNDVTGQIASTAANAFRLVYNKYGAIIRNDGEYWWFLITAQQASNDAAKTAGWADTSALINNSHPLRINLANGRVSINGYTIDKSVPSNAVFTDNNTTYTIATGDSNGQIKVTPSSGSAYNVSVKGLGSAAYTASTAYAAASHTHSSITGTYKHDAAVPTSTVGVGILTSFYNVSASDGNMPKSNNANAILQINKHSGEYDSQIGFSSNGNIYYRSANGSAFTTSSPWKQLAWNDEKLGTISDGSYWGMASPTLADNVWIRTTSLGIIPYQSGGLNAGHQSIGTSSWYFSHIYVDNFHGCTLTLGSSSVQGRIDIQSTTTASVSYNSANPRIRFKNAGGNQNIDIIMSDYDSVRAPAAISIHGNQGGEYLLAPNVASWDYTNNTHTAMLRTFSTGTTSAVGSGRVIAGNSIKKGTAGNARGYIEIYSEQDGCAFLVAPATITTSQSGYVVTLPSSAGVLALVGDNNHTHTYIESKANYTFTSSTLPNSFDWGVSAGFVNSDSGFGSYGSVLTVRTYSGGGGTLQLYAPYSSNYGGTHLKARFGNYASSSGNSWTSLRELAWNDEKLGIATVTGSPDLDTYLTTGIYTINTSSAVHSPTTNYSTLFVDGSVGTPFQILKPDANDTTWYTRHRNNSAGTWGSWVALTLDGVPNTEAGVSAAINKLSTGTSTPSDADYYVAQYAGGGTSVTSYHRRSHSALFAYINSKLYKILWSGSTSCTARSSTSITLTTAISANKYRFIKVVWNCGSYTGTSEFRADTLNVTNNIPSGSDATTTNMIQFKIASDGKSITVGPGTTTITVLQIAGVYPI